MLQRLYIDNYRHLVNFELRLQELSLLLGRNGAGKTSVLEVAHQRVGRQRRIGPERLTSNGGPLFSCVLGSVQLYRDDHSAGPRYDVDWSESALARVAAGKDNRRLTRFRDFMTTVVVCRIHPASFRTESSNEHTLLKPDASNFADWYRHVLLEHPHLIADFNSAMAEVVDGFHALRLERVGQDTRALMVQFDEDGNAYELRFDEISDGQRALIALYGLIHLAKDQGPGTRRMVHTPLASRKGTRRARGSRAVRKAALSRRVGRLSQQARNSRTGADRRARR